MADQKPHSLLAVLYKRILEGQLQRNIYSKLYSIFNQAPAEGLRLAMSSSFGITLSYLQGED
jgi:hypothetical protein